MNLIKTIKKTKIDLNKFSNFLYKNLNSIILHY